MTPQEKRICEIAYNLSQAFLKAKRSGQNETLLSITGVIYGFNGLMSELIPEFKTLPLGKELFRIGLAWHKLLLSGKIPMMAGIGKGLTFEESDFDIEFLVDEVNKHG